MIPNQQRQSFGAESRSLLRKLCRTSVEETSATLTRYGNTDIKSMKQILCALVLYTILRALDTQSTILLLLLLLCYIVLQLATMTDNQSPTRSGTPMVVTPSTTQQQGSSMLDSFPAIERPSAQTYREPSKLIDSSDEEDRSDGLSNNKKYGVSYVTDNNATNRLIAEAIAMLAQQQARIT